MASLVKAEQLQVPFSAIHIPPFFNIRDEELLEKDGKKIEELKESILSGGLLTPLSVRPHDTIADAFWLTSGRRRHMAMKLAGLRGTVPVVLKAVSPVEALLDNAAENTGREDVHPADLAKRLFELETGTFPGADELGNPKVERADICKRLALSGSYVSNLVHAWRVLSPELRRAWRHEDVPTDQINVWKKVKGEDEQLEALNHWRAARDAKKAAKAAGKKKGKKAKADAGEKVKFEPKKRGEINEQLAKFEEKIEKGPALSARDLEVAEAKIATLRWVIGATKRLTLT